MNLAKWILVGYMALQTLYLVARVGKPRDVITPLTAAFGLLEFGGIVWLVVIA